MPTKEVQQTTISHSVREAPKSVRQYLQLAGVSSAQLETISYGEESPVDGSSNEDAWKRKSSCCD